MASNTLKEIANAKAKLAQLEKKAADEQKKRIVNLHKKAGFATRVDRVLLFFQGFGWTCRSNYYIEFRLHESCP